MHPLMRMATTAATASAAVLALLCPADAVAQMPNAPVLQNVWANPGLVGAFDVAGGAGGSVYGLAGAWTPSAGRFQLSGGVGFQSRPATQGGGAGFAYGGRVALPLASAAGNFGFAVFAGLGGGQQRVETVDTTFVSLTTGEVMADTASTNSAIVQVPLGASVGWRRAIGATHGISVYASPSYVFVTSSGTHTGALRAALGADFGITRAIGVTAGVEFGQTRPTGSVGPTGTLWGFGVSYALGNTP